MAFKKKETLDLILCLVSAIFSEQSRWRRNNGSELHWIYWEPFGYHKYGRF